MTRVYEMKSVSIKIKLDIAVSCWYNLYNSSSSFSYLHIISTYLPLWAINDYFHSEYFLISIAHSFSYFSDLLQSYPIIYSMADRLALFMTVCAYQLFEPHMKFMSEMNFSNLLHITVLDFLQCIDTVSKIFRYCSARFRWFLNFSCFVLIGSN